MSCTFLLALPNLQCFTTRAAVIAKGPALLRDFEAGWAGSFPEIGRRRGAISLRTRARAGARSLRLAQRIIIGFVQALNFATAEALIRDLKPCAEGFGYA